MQQEWDGVAMPRRILAVLAVMFAVSMSVVDGVIANIALPTICSNLNIGSAQSIWVINAYQISIIISLLPLAAFGDAVGYRRVYLVGLSIFTFMSVGCALSRSFEMLILCRVLQGIGASAVMSVNTSLVRLIYPRRMLGRGLGINSTVVSVSAVAGPTLAASILAVAEWPYLFAINMPLGFMAIFLGYKYLPQNPSKGHFSEYRWDDALLSAITFGLLFAIVTGASHGLSWWIVALLIFFLVMVGSHFVRGQLRRAKPILPFDLLRIPVFSLSVVTSIMSFVSQMSIMVALPFILQNQFGYSPIEIGAVLTAWPAVNIFSTPIAGFLVERYNARVLGCVGLVILTIGMVALVILPEQPTTLDFIWRLAICGAGFGFFQAPNNSMIISSAPLNRSGSASGMMASARLMGQISGAALVAMLLYDVANDHLIDILYLGVASVVVALLLSLARLSTPTKAS